MERHVRIKRATFNYLCGFLKNYLEYNAGGWTIEFELYIFLFWLAAGTSYRVLAQTFKIPKSTVCDIAHRLLKALITKINLIIKLPHSSYLETVGNGFARLAKNRSFRKAAGAIDGCHIAIIAPTNLQQDYFCRKLFTSINSQAIVNHKYQFIDFFTGYPGSVHDSRVLINSTVYNQGKYPPIGFYLLGDSGYPCIVTPISIVTPFKHQPTAEQIQFNLCHSRARSIVERAFGMLKARWCTLFKRPLENKVKTSVKIIAVCAMLHNICIDNNDLINPIVEYLETEIQDDVELVYNENTSLRTEIFSQFCSHLNN